MAKEVECKPAFIEIRVPLKGLDGDDFELELRNTTNNRLTYKLTGTKCNKFGVIEPMFGFIEPNRWTDIRFQPLLIRTIEGFTKDDKFIVHYATAPADKKIKAGDIWKKGNPLEPKVVKTVDVPMRIYDIQKCMWLE